MDTQAILRMIGALGSAVGGVAGSFGGTASPTSLPPATAPTLDQLTLNPQVMGESPRVPYDFGQGQNIIPPETQPPLLPPGQTADQAAATATTGKQKTWQEHVMDVGKAITSSAKASKDINSSPLAQRMFQEQQQNQLVQNQVKKNQMEVFKRNDLSSQILEKYGLL
jgi:hypothetical protein